MEPPASRPRAVVAVAPCVAKVSAIAAPTAALPPLELPDAVVVVVPVVAAMNDIAPVEDCSGPGFACAELFALLMVSAIAGATVTPPPAAPVVAVVCIVMRPNANSDRSSTLVSIEPVPSSAVVVALTRLRATDAPTPTLEPPVVAAFAVALDVASDVAVNVASPVPADAVAPGRVTASVSTLPTTSASDPATPTDAPAPLVALAERSLVAGVVAFSARPAELEVPSIDAVLLMFAKVIATAAPIAALPPVVALPFAVLEASPVSVAFRVSRPPLRTDAPGAIAAVLRAVANVSATAAATLIGPAEVDADGAAVPPEPVPPFAAAVVSAFERSAAIWPSTSLGAEDDVPEADAVALDDVVEGPLAVKVSVPPALIGPSASAFAVWFAKVS